MMSPRTFRSPSTIAGALGIGTALKARSTDFDDLGLTIDVAFGQSGHDYAVGILHGLGGGRVAAPPEAGFDSRILVAADASVRDLERSISQLLSASALESGAGPTPVPRVLPARP